RDESVENADMEVVLHVDTHRVDDGGVGRVGEIQWLRSLPQHDRLDRLDQDVEIEADRQVLDVIEVELQFLQRVLRPGPVGVPNLDPPGQNGTHDVALPVEQSHAGQIRDDLRAPRS